MLLFVCLCCVAVAHAQTWKEMSNEQKMLKLKEFRADNQKFLKEKLSMSTDQLTDIDNVNLCFLSTIDRIDRYGKTDEGKQQYASVALAARDAQLDAIMGTEKRDQFIAYVKAKLQKAGLVDK